MKLDFIEEAAPHATDQIIRLYDFNAGQATSLHQAIQQTLIREGEALDLARLNFIEPLNCHLLLCLAGENRGIRRIGQGEFVCELTKGGYQTMLELLGPFCSGRTGFQYLYDLHTPIDFLISVNGQW